MMLSNPPKALIVMVSLLCVTMLMLFDRVDSESGLAIIGLIVGYAIGNGIAAKQGDSVDPIFAPKDPHRRATDKETDNE